MESYRRNNPKEVICRISGGGLGFKEEDCGPQKFILHELWT
jgi:hypothetical protein